jgi:hypothetical protein
MPVNPVTVPLGTLGIPTANVVVVGAGVPSTVNVLLLNNVLGMFVMWYNEPTTGVVGGVDTTNVNTITELG